LRNLHDTEAPISVHGWPLVEVCFNGPASAAQVNQWLEVMNALFERQQSFGLLTMTSTHSDFSDAGRRAMGLWFKQNRELLAQYCVGVARVAAEDSAVERLAGPKMQAAMPCPIFASVDKAVARGWLQEKLTP
jgi:hypothetical protein